MMKRYFVSLHWYFAAFACIMLIIIGVYKHSSVIPMIYAILIILLFNILLSKIIIMKKNEFSIFGFGFKSFKFPSYKYEQILSIVIFEKRYLSWDLYISMKDGRSIHYRLSNFYRKSMQEIQKIFHQNEVNAIIKYIDPNNPYDLPIKKRD